MALIDELADQPQKNSWVQDLIAQRYQPKTERLKREPVGFSFKRDPFDPSSYYKALGQYKDIAKLATNVTLQEAENKKQSEMQAAYDASQKAMQDALKGVNPNYTYSGAGSGSSKHYNLKGITSTTAAGADFFGSKYGIKTIYGLGKGSVPGSDHPKGRATDFMINNLKNGHAVGEALANDAVRNYKSMGIKYVIWNRYIWQPGSGWRKYNGPSPHTDHVHISYLR